MSTNFPCRRCIGLVLIFLISHFPFLISHSSFLICTISAQEVPMDYSYCGYYRSEKPIPSVKVVAYVQPTGGDDAAALQAAIDRVSRMKPDKLTGLRGAILLAEGTYRLSQPLRISTGAFGARRLELMKVPLRLPRSSSV